MSTPDGYVETRRVLELLVRGDKPGHPFHGNEYSGGGGGGGGKPLTRKQALEGLRAAGYTGPTSFSVTRLNEIHAAHTAQQGHPPTTTAAGTVSAPAPKSAAPRAPKLTTQGVRKAIEESIQSGAAHGGYNAQVKMAEKTTAPVLGKTNIRIGSVGAMTSGVQTKLRTGSHPDLPGYNHRYVDVTMGFSSKNIIAREKIPQVKAEQHQATQNVMGAVAAKGYRVHQGSHDVPFNRFQVYEAT